MADLEKIADRFNTKGYIIMEVGGSVRDSLMGKVSDDIDLTTDAVPEVTLKILEDFGTVYRIGEKYGTIGLILPDETKIEVTTFRTEKYTENSRKPEVCYGLNLDEDLFRRDFTINAIARNIKTGELHDPYNGARDIELGIIKCVNDHKKTFADDPLRMMRGIRFEAKYRGFRFIERIPEPARLKIISQERIRDELTKILMTEQPAKGIRRLASLGLMSYIIPELLKLKTIPHGEHHFKNPFDHTLLVIEKGAKMSDDIVFRYACLFHDIAKPETVTEDETGIHFFNHHDVGTTMTRTLMHRLRFDIDTIDRVAHLVHFHMTPITLDREITGATDWHRKKVVGRLVNKVGRNNIYQLLNLVRCDIASSRNPRHEFVEDLRGLVEEYISYSPNELKSPLNGEEIMEITSLKPGETIGEIKERLLELVIDRDLVEGDKERAKVLVESWGYNKR